MTAGFTGPIDYYVPGVQAPVTGVNGVRSAPLGVADAPRAAMGLLDVTLPPFSADPTGVRDSTAALQSAVWFARRNHRVVYLPVGDYKITDTIVINETPAAWGGGRFLPTVLRGELTSSKRATIVLPPSTAGFTDPTNPKMLLHFLQQANGANPEPNINFNQMIIGVNVRIGDGNFGAIAVRNRGAQGTGYEDVTVYAGDALVGVQGASGSGGSQHALTVIGGAFGLDFREGQPAATVSGVTLVNQTCGAIVWCGLQSLNVIGAVISANEDRDDAYAAVRTGASMGKYAAPLHLSAKCVLPQQLNPQTSDLAVSGYLSIVDSVLSVSGRDNVAPAVVANSSVWLDNVFATGFPTLAQFPRSGHTLRANSSGGTTTHIVEYAHAELPPPHKQWANSPFYQLENPLVLDGTAMPNGTDITKLQVATPPADIQSRHTWGAAEDFPSFESPGAVSVRDAPYFAKGDGVTDDTEAISAALASHDIVVLPPGAYRVSSTLSVRAGAALVGVAHTLCSIVPVSSANGTWPLVTTLGGGSEPRGTSGLGTVFAFISTGTYPHTPGVTSMLWQADNPRSVYRGNAAWLATECLNPGGLLPTRAPCPRRANHSLPNIQVRGAGMFFTEHHEDSVPMGPGYRHVLIEANTGSVRFYHLNAEHAMSDANVEIRDSQNGVAIYGLKSEGRYGVLWMRNSSDVYLSGYGGNACAFAPSTGYPTGFADYPPTLWRIEGSRNYTLANMMGYEMGGTLSVSSGLGKVVSCAALDKWHSLWEDNVTLPVLQRPLIYRRT